MSEDKEKLKAAGFIFSNEVISEKARKEMNAVSYLKGELAKLDGPHLLIAYKGLIDKDVFDTAEGYSFLKFVQQKLIADDSVDNSEIPPIPVYDSSEVVKANIEQMEPVWKRRFFTLITVTIALLACIVFMFVLTATRDSPDILNYKQKLVDHYARWDESLTKREEQVRKREEELMEKEDGAKDSKEGTENGSE